MYKRQWQNRPLDICYPLVFFDAIRVKVRDEGFVRNLSLIHIFAEVPSVLVSKTSLPAKPKVLVLPGH